MGLLKKHISILILKIAGGCPDIEDRIWDRVAEGSVTLAELEELCTKKEKENSSQSKD